MRSFARFLGSLLVSGCLAGSLASCTTASVTSGITGHTAVVGGCVETPESTPCPVEPLPARISILDAKGGKIGETTSNDKGEFRMELPAGTYEIRAVNLMGAPLPTALPAHVVVTTGAFTDVAVAFDSGVR
jgi:hypothetical protein